MIARMRLDCVFALQVKGRRRSEALGPGVKALSGLSPGDWADHRLRPFCMQGKGTLRSEYRLAVKFNL